MENVFLFAIIGIAIITVVIRSEKRMSDMCHDILTILMEAFDIIAWKPTAEQLNALKDIKYKGNTKDNSAICSLYDDFNRMYNLEKEENEE